MPDPYPTHSLSLRLLRAHLYVGGAHITVRSPRGLMQTAPKGFALLETHKDASLLDLDQVSLGWTNPFHSIGFSDQRFAVGTLFILKY